MPNWCYNNLTLTHEDSSMIERAEKAFIDSRLLSEFIPNDGSPDLWCEHNVSNWGTKWDISGDEGSCDREDANTVSMSFDSAWSPPVIAYAKLENMGFTVRANYYEPGMAFAGIYKDGFDDYYDYSKMTSDEIEQQLPQDLLDLGIADDVRCWEEEQDENNEGDE